MLKLMGKKIQFYAENFCLSKPVYNILFFLFQDVPFKSVSVDEFEKHLDKSNSVADLLRIFFDRKDLSDFDINTIMNMKSKQFIYGTSHQKRENVNTARSWMNDDEDDIEGKVSHVKLLWRPMGTF